MRRCHYCDGLINIDCFNEVECGIITRNIEMEQEQEHDDAIVSGICDDCEAENNDKNDLTEINENNDDLPF